MKTLGSAAVAFRRSKLQDFANITWNSLWICAFGPSQLFNLVINYHMV